MLALGPKMWEKKVELTHKNVFHKCTFEKTSIYKRTHFQEKQLHRERMNSGKERQTEKNR